MSGKTVAQKGWCVGWFSESGSCACDQNVVGLKPKVSRMIRPLSKVQNPHLFNKPSDPASPLYIALGKWVK